MIGAVIQARLGSRRLPRTVLADIAGKPLLTRVIERVRQVSGVERVVVATPVGDLPELQAVVREPVFWWGGAGEDVLARYVGAARSFGLDPIMRITADCPLLDPAACDRVLRAYQTGGFDYVSNVHPSTDGLDCEVFSWWALEETSRCAILRKDREHVTSWMRRRLQCRFVAEPPLPDKWSVDTAQDLARVRDAWTSSNALNV